MNGPWLPIPSYVQRAHKYVCDKRGYHDKKAAISEINKRTTGRQKVRHNRPTYLRAYPCRICGKWHLTSKTFNNE